MGMLGLVVDLGLGRFQHRIAQSAAESAALSAASKALESIGQGDTPSCSFNASCQGATACPAPGTLNSACLYAAQNGFTNGGVSGRQTVMIAADVGSSAPNVPAISDGIYWAQVTTGQTSKQGFSSVLGKEEMSVRVRATAAILNRPMRQSLYLLNRQSDCVVSALGIGLVCGMDFLGLIDANVNAAGGITMASANARGTLLPQVAAGTVIGTAQFTSSYTHILGNGGINTLGLSNWSPAPVNGFPDSDDFRDPMRGKGQPPAPTGLVDRPVPGGIITGNLLSNLLSGSPTNLPPGNYYATNPLTGAPLGTPVTVVGNVQFTDGANPPCGGFCNYVFYGGLVTAAASVTTFSPGRYVFAGAQPVQGGPGVALSLGANSVVRDLTPLVNGQAAQNSDAGEIFVFTDSQFSGLQVPAAIQNSGLSLPHATAGFQGGLGFKLTLHGLNSESSAVPANLKTFAPTVIWQDQANTTVRYQSNGTLDVSCGGLCSRILSVPGSQQMILQGSQSGGQPAVNIYGTIYGPRGSWITTLGLLPGDTIAGPLQIITGALQMAIQTRLDLSTLNSPIRRRVVALVE
jgi:hypothetical protein